MPGSETCSTCFSRSPEHTSALFAKSYSGVVRNPSRLLPSRPESSARNPSIRFAQNSSRHYYNIMLIIHRSCSSCDAVKFASRRWCGQLQKSNNRAFQFIERGNSQLKRSVTSTKPDLSGCQQTCGCMQYRGWDSTDWSELAGMGSWHPKYATNKMSRQSDHFVITLLPS